MSFWATRQYLTPLDRCLLADLLYYYLHTMNDRFSRLRELLREAAFFKYNLSLKNATADDLAQLNEASSIAFTGFREALRDSSPTTFFNNVLQPPYADLAARLFSIVTPCESAAFEEDISGPLLQDSRIRRMILEAAENDMLEFHKFVTRVFLQVDMADMDREEPTTYQASLPIAIETVLRAELQKASLQQQVSKRFHSTPSLVWWSLLLLGTCALFRAGGYFAKRVSGK